MWTTKCTEDKNMHSCSVSWFTQLHGCLWYWKCMQGWSVSRSKLLKCTSEAPVTYEQHSMHDCTYCKSIILHQTSGFKVCLMWKDLRLEQSPVACCWRKKWVPWQMATCSRPQHAKGVSYSDHLCILYDIFVVKNFSSTTFTDEN